MESAIAPCIELTKCACSPMARRIKLLRELKHNMDVLTRKKDELVAMESDIRTRLRVAEEERKQPPLEDVQLWLDRVEGAKTRVSNIGSPSQRNSCYFSTKVFYLRIKLAKVVEKEITELDRLLGKEFREGLVADAPAENAILFDPPPLHGQPTAKKTMDEIMKLLLDSPEVGKIGVHGMGGVGKTTIVMNINNKLAEMMKTNKRFDKIIWVTVSKEVGSIREIQQKIAQELREEFRKKLSEWDDEVRRAAALLGELKSIGKFLIILDDLWKEITLQEIGIPQPNKDNNCKVLVTTRHLKYCDAIETQKNVQVECLSDQEAWDLFAFKLSDHVLANKDPKFRDVAEQVVRECRGLPLGIITIGCAMRRKQNIEQWERALNELRRSTSDLGMGEKVFKLLRFSYNNLKSRVFQKCFLYCAFFPEDAEISKEELIEYWVAEGYMEEEGIDDQYDNWDMKAAMNKGFQILEELQDACMLEIGQIWPGKCVRMHDLVRDLAINIMREKDFEFLAKAGLQREDLSKEQWERANKISFIETAMVNFPKQLNCPRLTTLLMQNHHGRAYDFVFPPCFFSQMPTLRILNLARVENLRISYGRQLLPSLSNLVSLRYLNLSGNSIEELPEVGNLLNLRYLDLCFTRIRELPDVGKLLNLIHLNLSFTDIRELPRGLGALFRLQFLDLTGNELVDIDFNLLSKLTLLAELHLPLVGLQNIQEITHLRCLENLFIRILDYKDYLEVLKQVPWDLVKRFNIEVILGGSWSFNGNFLANHVKIQKFDICNELSSFCLPKNTEVLALSDCKIPPLSRLQCLKELRLLKGLDLKTISVSGNIPVRGEEMEPNALASLEDLYCLSLEECKYIIQGKLPSGCLANLKSLDIVQCKCLKSLFSFQILSHLNNIESIKVYECSEIEEIVGDSDEDNLGVTTTKNTIILPNLQKLGLEKLEKLKSISRKTTWVCDSLVRLYVKACPQIEARLPFKKNLGANKCNIKGSRSWWEALQCDDAETKTLFQFSEFTKEEEPVAIAWL